MLEGKAIVCLSAVDWEGVIWARPQQLMSRLARDSRILYVEPPITLLSPFKNPALWSKYRQWLRGPRWTAEHIHVVTPPILLPFGSRYRCINRLNQRLLGLFLDRIIRRLGLGATVLWTYLPNTADLADIPGQTLLCYDCVDEHSEFSGFSREVVLAMEQDLLHRADITFASAASLFEGKKSAARRIFLIPNAADIDHYRQAAAGALPRPADLAGMSGPLIGFIGGIHDWIDLDTVRFLAQSHPEWEVVMIGPVNTDTGTPLPNLHYLGGRSYGELPAYLQQFTVGIIPFKINELTRNVNPVKLYEYLAAGKPVVSSALPELQRYREIITIVANREEFLAGVEQACREDSPERRQQRLAMAAANSWEARCQEMAGHIAEFGAAPAAEPGWSEKGEPDNGL